MKYRIKENVLWKVVDSEAVIVEPGRDEYCYLNVSGTDIWQMINDDLETEEICEGLSRSYDASPNIIKRDVETLIAELIYKGLLEEINNDG